jgi:hypothetical protein
VFLLRSFDRYLLKFSPVIFKNSFPAGVVLPAPHDHVDIPWIELNKPRLPASGFAGDQGRSGSSEGIKHNTAALTALLDCSPADSMQVEPFEPKASFRILQERSTAKGRVGSATWPLNHLY